MREAQSLMKSHVRLLQSEINDNSGSETAAGHAPSARGSLSSPCRMSSFRHFCELLAQFRPPEAEFVSFNRSDGYATQDSIDVQRRRVADAKSEMHELVIVTREIIAQSRAIMSEADRLIGRSAPRRSP